MTVLSVSCFEEEAAIDLSLLVSANKRSLVKSYTVLQNIVTTTTQDCRNLISFIFMQFSVKFWANNRLVSSLLKYALHLENPGSQNENILSYRVLLRMVNERNSLVVSSTRYSRTYRLH